MKLDESNIIPSNTFYSQEEVDKLTSEAYNQGYEDGKVFFYGMTSRDEESIKQISETL
jgi:hypothetical protein